MGKRSSLGAFGWLFLSFVLPLGAHGAETLKGVQKGRVSSQALAASSQVLRALHAVRPGDLLRIHVFREDDLDTEARVSQDGTITFPLLGRVAVAGKYPQEIAATLRELLGRDYLVNPQVTVSVIESERKITVLGQVQKPGSYTLPMERRINVLEAVGLAGGFTRLADPSHVTVKRKEGGKETVYRINAKAMANREIEAFEVLPDDIITVAESLF
jgi:protein involved in polysaccharide export with SLBB domain